VCFSLTLLVHSVDINGERTTKSVTKNVHRHVFKSQKNDLCNWGWAAFMSSNKIAREGYLHCDELQVTATIAVESTSIVMNPSEVDVYLSYAAESGCEDSVKICLAQGACVNSESEDKFTPLHYACNATTECLPVVQLLIQQGADVNKLNKYGETALLKAAYRGHVGVVKTLLDSGSNMEPTSTAGLSALSAAVGQVSILFMYAFSFIFIYLVTMFTLLTLLFSLSG
jgi:ankyrin repeat protein